jgi:hypothetical protein
MVLQLVLNKDGNYEYQDPRVNKAPVIDTSAFEAYESKQKTTLAGNTDIGAQTQQLIRETPGQYTTTFNEETGQFETKQKDQTTPVTVDVKPIEQTTVAPQETALQKVSRITAASQPTPIDFKQVAKDTAEMFRPTVKDQLFTAALDVGKDVAIRYATQKVLGKTFAGQLASANIGMGTTGINAAALANPYTLAAAALFTKPGQKVAKAIVKPVKKVVKKVTRAISKIFSDIRLKTNIELIGKSPSNINIYEFSYIGSPIKYVGVMAHEVPWAAEKHESGYLMVDYDKVDVEFRRLN